MNPESPPTRERESVQSQLMRYGGVLLIAVALTIFYVAAITIWEAVADPSGVALLVAALALIIPGRIIGRRFGVL